MRAQKINTQFYREASGGIGAIWLNALNWNRQSKWDEMGVSRENTKTLDSLRLGAEAASAMLEMEKFLRKEGNIEIVYSWACCL